MGKGMKAFVAAGFSPRTITQKAAAYTALLTDDQISATTAITVTLPVISTMIGTVIGKKVYKLKAPTATYALTVAPGSGNTINGLAGYVIAPGQSIVIAAEAGKTDWEIISPDASLGIAARFHQTVLATTNGTTPVNVFSSAGAPNNFTVESFEAIAADATASNIVLKNGTATVASVAKGTTANAVVGEETLANIAVTKGAVFTVESSGTGNAICKIGITDIN